MVGDGKHPNVFFVTVNGNVVAVFVGDARKTAAIELARRQPGKEVLVEDRTTGIVWDVEEDR